MPSRFDLADASSSAMRRPERDRGELAVGGGIELDRQSQTIGIVLVSHVSP